MRKIGVSLRSIGYFFVEAHLVVISAHCLLAVPKMLDECLEYLEQRIERDSTFQYEVIVVSDGSRDATVEIGHLYSNKYSTDKVRMLVLKENRGKGGAVRLVCMELNQDLTFFANLTEIKIF